MAKSKGFSWLEIVIAIVIVTVLLVVVLGSTAIKMRMDYCAEKEYFFVYDSIVYPVGKEYEHAMQLAHQFGMYADGERWERNAFMGIKSPCEELVVW